MENNIKIIPLLISLTIMLSGCSEGQQETLIVHKTGSSYEERKIALHQCKVSALSKIPRSMAVDYRPGYSSPGSLYCNTIGQQTSCNRIGAINIPASTSTYDANLELRTTEIKYCLNSRGYQTLLKPACKTDAEKAAAKKSTIGPQPSGEKIPCGIG